MIRIYSFNPEHFNNNGDQGNVAVLAAELAAAGEEHLFTSKLDEADFVLFGDASRAVMRHYSDELKAYKDKIKERYLQGLPTLLVGSCYEYFASTLGLEQRQIPRQSGFIHEEHFGYRNSDNDLKPVTKSGLFIATSLFGPFLAKNPKDLRELLEGLGADPNLNPERMKWIEKIREVSGG